MKNYFRLFALIIFSVILSSCEIDTELEDTRVEYVGEWDYNDEMLVMKKDYTSVSISIDVNSEDGIIISNFANLHEDLHCRVEGNYVEINQSTLGGLSISGSGVSNYRVDEIEFLFTLDGDDFRAIMTKK